MTKKFHSPLKIFEIKNKMKNKNISINALPTGNNIFDYY